MRLIQMMRVLKLCFFVACAGEIYMTRIAAFIFSLAIVALACAAPAAALSHSNLLGQWCGDKSNPVVTKVNFAQKAFTTVWPQANNRTKTRPIQRYEFAETTITVNYVGEDAKEVFVVYGEFSRDGRRMAQLPGHGVPRYAFYRC